jgi:hypothetical protein
MMSNAIKVALEAIATTDDYAWAEFNFFPCPDGTGSPTPAGCAADPGYGKGPNCCLHDKFESCMVQQFQCFPNNTKCNTDLRLKLSQFLSCFEGSHIEEDVCNADALTCLKQASLDSQYDTIMSCYNNTTQVRAAGTAMEALCKQANPQWWPYVFVNGKLLCGDDSCMMPLLPQLCKAYKSTPKPKSCQALGIF